MFEVLVVISEDVVTRQSSSFEPFAFSKGVCLHFSLHTACFSRMMVTLVSYLISFEHYVNLLFSDTRLFFTAAVEEAGCRMLCEATQQVLLRAQSGL